MKENFILTTKTESADGNYVLRSGKIFQAGKYPDKKFEITKEELKKAAEDFNPVDLDIEHGSTVFDGKIGSLSYVKATEDGELYGGALIPKWLDDVLGGKYKVSATWSGDKKLKGLAIVKNPRISDAALFTAYNFSISAAENDMDKIFAEMSQTWDGRSVIQQVHDLCSRCGAICDEENESKMPNYYYSKIDDSLEEVFEFVSKEESKTLQKLHDTATKAGAKCSFIEKKNFSGASGTRMEGIKMTIKELKDSLVGLLKNVPDEDAPETKTVVETKTTVDNAGKDFSVESRELQDKIAAIEAQFKADNEAKAKEAETLKNEVEALKAEKRQATEDALVGFVDSLAGKKFAPAQKDEVVSFFKQLMADDETAEHKFSVNDKTFSRVELAKKIFSEVADLDATKEKVFSATVLGTDGDNSDLDKLKADIEAHIAKKNPTIK